MDLFGVFGHVAQRIAPDSRVTAEQMEQVHPPLTSFEQYIKGLVAMAPATKESFLMRAVKLAPTFQRARIALWDVYTEQGRHREALAMVREVAPASRVSRQARFLSSLSLMHLGQFAEAFDLLTDLNRAAPDSALLNNLGVIQVRRPSASGGRPITYFNDAARLDTNDADLFFNLGYAFFLDRDMPAAVYWLREAVRRNAADEQAHYILGVALQATGSTAEGAREKELAKRLSSVFLDWERQPSAPVPRGLERIKTEVDIPAALRVDNVIVAAGQRDQQEMATIQLERGRRLFQAERNVEAISELRRAIYLAPYQHEAHLLLGEIYLQSGRIDEAIDELKISLWSQDTLAAHLRLGEVYVAARNLDLARTELQSVLARDPGNSRAKQLLAQLP
jgi:Flp pilus assembly protein TadD